MAAFAAVVTTGIYCRPGCGAQPRARNVRPFPTAAAAEAAGYRACLRCRPYREPPPAGWGYGELACRAVRLILDGALDGHGEADLAARLGVSGRHLRRLFTAELGVTPDGLARSARAHFARRLLDDTDLPIADIAFAVGYGSVRQLNRSVQATFRASPTALRARRRIRDRLAADGGLPLRLAFRGQLDWLQIACWLAAGQIPGVERVEGLTYRRIILVNGEPGVIELLPASGGSIRMTAHLPYWAGLAHIVSQARRIASLDSDPAEPASRLGGDPVLGPLLAARPGLRAPGTWNPFETGVLAIIGGPHPGAAAARRAGRLARALGTPAPGLAMLGLTHAFPAPATVAAADLAGLLSDVPATTTGAIAAFARAVSGDQIRLDGSTSLGELTGSLTAIPGINVATAHYLAWRMGERDAFPPCPGWLPAGPDMLAARAWRPWRALAAAHLLAAGTSETEAAAHEPRQSPSGSGPVSGDHGRDLH